MRKNESQSEQSRGHSLFGISEATQMSYLKNRYTERYAAFDVLYREKIGRGRARVCEKTRKSEKRKALGGREETLLARVGDYHFHGRVGKVINVSAANVRVELLSLLLKGKGAPCRACRKKNGVSSILFQT